MSHKALLKYLMTVLYSKAGDVRNMGNLKTGKGLLLWQENVSKSF